MDMKMQAFLDKVKDMADKTGKVSRHAAGVAGKKANDLALATRINLQIFDLNTECEALYKEIGKLVYDLHRGAEVTNEEMDEKMAQVDAKQEKLAALRDKLAAKGVQFSTGCAPLPPLPANKGCGGMTMGASGMSLPSSVTGIIAGCASVICPAKIWMPSMRTVR